MNYRQIRIADMPFVQILTENAFKFDFLPIFVISGTKIFVSVLPPPPPFPSISFIHHTCTHQSTTFMQTKLSLDGIAISVQGKFNCITVNFEKIQHGIYVIDILFISRIFSEFSRVMRPEYSSLVSVPPIQEMRSSLVLSRLV